ncbi:hypothetical protein ACQJBY_065601 [Aegilops geniculata]
MRAAGQPPPHALPATGPPSIPRAPGHPLSHAPAGLPPVAPPTGDQDRPSSPGRDPPSSSPGAAASPVLATRFPGSGEGAGERGERAWMSCFSCFGPALEAEGGKPVADAKEPRAKDGAALDQVLFWNSI